MGKTRRRYNLEFKAEAVRLICEEKLSQTRVARDLGISETSISRWLQQARVDDDLGKPGELTTAEKKELRDLRKEVRILRQEREILKNAVAFFAKEMS
jgi:transposase